MEQMVGMLIGPATIFSLGQLIVAGMTIAYTSIMIPSSNAFSLNVEQRIQKIHSELQVANQSLRQVFDNTFRVS